MLKQLQVFEDQNHSVRNGGGHESELETNNTDTNKSKITAARSRDIYDS